MKWLREIPKPLLKRFVIASIVFPPMVALTNVGTNDKAESKQQAIKAQDTLKIYRKTANVSKPVVIQKTAGSFFDSRCTGFQTPGL